jgi:UDP-N-acetylmuramoylalanine--D-glutamate ligase
LATFRPLEHRFELVPSNDERAWIDDSLATTPESVVAALKATPGRRVAVLVGGADRGLSYDVLLDYLCDVTGVSLVLTGPVGARLAAEAAECGLGPRVFASMAEAFAWARSPENRSEVVLLSPGATSFDEYDDYKARSAAFRRAALGE